MAFQVSPGINVSELDLTAGAKQISVSDAGFAGPFQWGPALVERTIGSEDELVRTFGKPDDTIYSWWFAAQSFLAYSNLLHCVRALSDDALNATGDDKLLAGTVRASNGTYTFTNSTAAFVASTLVPGQKVTVGNTEYTVNSVSTASFTTEEVIPTWNVATTLSIGGGATPTNLQVLLTNTSINAQAFFANGQTLYVNSSLTLSVDVVTNSSVFTVSSSPGATNAAITWIGTNYVGNTVSYFGAKVANEDAYDQTYSAGVTGLGPWVVKWPGELGNSLKISVCPSNTAFWSNATSGALTTTVSSTAVTGSNTLFEAELIVGDYIIVGGRSYQVASIQSNTALTLATAAYATVTATAGTWARKWEFNSQFDRAPGTSIYAADRGGSRDEMHICVVDEDGAFTGTAGTVLERYAFVSKASDAKTQNGEGNYYAQVINRQSAYIWWLDHPGTSTNFGTTVVNTTFGVDTLPLTHSLWGGQTDNANIADADIQAGYDIFKNTDDIDISLIIAGPSNAAVSNYLIQDIAEQRMDCVVFCSPSYASVVNNIGDEVTDITTFRNSLPSSSYGICDSGWKYTYDKWNDKYRWVPLNGDTAGIAARSDTTNDPWFSPAGFTRGNVKNVVKLAWNPKQLDRDEIYKIGINPVVSFPSQGVVLYGDKTLLDRPSAFDRINVRRLFIVLEKTIARLARTQLFEFNDEFTRSQFRNIVEPYLRDVKARRGVVDYRVICDESNNTAEVIEQNRFVGDIFVKPARAINFIQLNFVAVRSGVSFQEVTGVI